MRFLASVLALFSGVPARASVLPDRLETKRLELVRLQTSDLPCLILLQTNPVVMRYVNATPRDEKAVRHFLDRELKFWKDRGFGYYIARKKPDGQFVAYVGLRVMDPPYEKDIEIGYVAGEADWQQGFATEALDALIESSFMELKLSRLLATVAVEHKSSFRLAEKFGMKTIEQAQYDGYLCNVLELTREAWLASRKP